MDLWRIKANVGEYFDKKVLPPEQVLGEGVQGGVEFYISVYVKTLS